MYQAKVCTTDDSECTLLPGLTNSPLGTCQVHQQVSQNFLHVRIHLHKSKCWIIETNSDDPTECQHTVIDISVCRTEV